MNYIEKFGLLPEIVKDNAKQILEVIKNVNPQFYKGKKESEIVAELNTIQYFIKDIPQNYLRKMCELAVQKYPQRKIENPKLVFNLDYILSFSVQAQFIIENDLTSLEDLWTDIDTLVIEGEDDEKAN